MKKAVLILLFSIIAVFAKEYSVIAFSTVKFNKKAAKVFIKRFPKGEVKQYSRYVEYKIEPFKTYAEAFKFLKKVRKFYRYPLIIDYNPHLGILLYPKIQKKAKQYTKSNNYEKYLTHCKNECGCIKQIYTWEINSSKIFRDINISVKNYLPEQNCKTVKTNKKIYKEKSAQYNKTYNNYICMPSLSEHIFYIDAYGNFFKGQKKTFSLKGNSENIKLGIMYTKYFWDYWKFFTDDRIILSRKDLNTQLSESLYFDVNELYIRSYCLYNGYVNFLIGRKKTKDLRSWWYDAPLDGIQVFNENALLTYRVILGGRINNETVTDDNSPKAKLKNSLFFIFHTNYEYFYRKNAGFYFIYEHTKPKTDILDRKITFLGINLNGYENSKYYWLDLGLSSGKITYSASKKSSNGCGFDIGVKIPYSSKLSFAGSYAFGGDSFTQPYIATDYSDYLNKNFSFRYYGNVLDPVLENMRILSLYGIYNFDTSHSLISALHNYKQNKAEIFSYNGDYLFPTNGKNKDIGNEIDFIYQYLRSKYQKLKIGSGFFFGEGAFDGLRNKNAFRIFVNYRYYWK